MENAKFTKMDEGFVCARCGKEVKQLGYTSRDHCPHCLYSVHLDINPGDRANECKGLMLPIDIEQKQKGLVIVYQCTKCHKRHKNKAASDDDYNTILKVMNKTYNL